MPNNSRTLRVLVVDDDSIIADTLKVILSNRGYDAFATYSAEQALEWCHNNRPDAVITDVVMGPMNGIQLAIQLAETVPDCRVMLLSGNAVTENLLRDFNAGAYNLYLLAKPVHPNEILQFLAGIQIEEL